MENTEGRSRRRTIISSLLVFLIIASILTTTAVLLWDRTGDSIDVPTFIIQEANGEAISRTLRHLTSEPHVAGTETDTKQAQWIADQWRQQGLDTVNLVPYDVLLSYPELDKNNTLQVTDGSGQVVWRSQGRQVPLHTGEEHPGVMPNFNAYSAPGNVEGPLIYAYLGRQEDFEYLQERNVSINGSVVLIRYGEIFRGNKVQEAEKRGAAGVLLYLDPIAVSPHGQDANETYPNTVYAPPDAVQLGTTFIENGDPLTPFYPSIKSAYRIPQKEALLPKIPVQPISYSDAEYLLSKMAGEAAPTSWQGGLNLTYRLGPGLNDPSLSTNLTVYTHNQMATIYNVVATIKGAEEPDRYVILGNHRDAWIFGGVDPSSGTAVMMEVSRMFGALLKHGVRPRRTLVFCSWAAEEYGLVGSTEWTEQFTAPLQNRAVAYLNVDMVFQGTYSLRSSASPLLYEILIRATRLVPNPNTDEAAAGRPLLFDTWLMREPDDRHPGRPRFFGLGSGSDFSSFQHVLGIPCLDLVYIEEPNGSSLPLYHTLYETYHLAHDLYDPSMTYHLALSQTWALAAYFLAQETVIPFSVDFYGEFLTEALKEIEDKYGNLLNQTQPQLDFLRQSVINFHTVTSNWKNTTASLDTKNILGVRAVNDALMLLDRAFLDPRGLPGRPNYNHVVTAPSSKDTYASDSFAGLQDLLFDLLQLSPDEQLVRWRQVDQHLSAITHLVDAAANSLSLQLW